jgi:tetratricopeptide (TPR) repeat protein
VGAFRRGIRLVEQAVGIARTSGNFYRELICIGELAMCNYTVGDWTATRAWGLEVVAKAQQKGDRYAVELGREFAGYATFMQGELEYGLSMLETVLRNQHVSRTPAGSSLNTGLMAEACFIAGHLSDGIKRYQDTLEHARRRDRVGLPVARRAMAIGLSQQNEPPWHDVEREIDASLNLAEEFGQRPDLAITRFRYAEILHKKGDLPAALEQLSEAEKLFAEMEMTWWSGQAAALRERIEGGTKFVWFAPYVDGPPALA